MLLLTEQRHFKLHKIDFAAAQTRLHISFM